MQLTDSRLGSSSLEVVALLGCWEIEHNFFFLFVNTLPSPSNVRLSHETAVHFLWSLGLSYNYFFFSFKLLDTI
jgi:hypothetical protein